MQIVLSCLSYHFEVSAKANGRLLIYPSGLKPIPIDITVQALVLTILFIAYYSLFIKKPPENRWQLQKTSV
jgi:uncharacterized membrane protein YqhA